MRYLYNTDILSFEDCINDRFIVCLGPSRYSLMDRIGRIADAEYKEIRPRFDGYFTVKNNWKTEMLMDKDGNIICEESKDIDLFTDDDIALVTELDGSKHWLTKQGVKFGDEFSDIGCFSGGFGCVMREDGSWTYVDKQMRMANVSFDMVMPFQHSIDHTYVKKDGKCYIINKNFEILSGPYEDIFWIEKENGLVVAESKNEKGKTVYTYYTPDGKQLSRAYEMVHGFKNGLSRVLTKDGYNFIDETGREICDRYFMTAWNFGEHFAWVCDFDENREFVHNYVRRDGTMPETWFPVVGNESEGLMSVMKGTRSYYIDEHEKIVSKAIKEPGMFHYGVATYSPRKGKVSYLTKEFVPFNEEFDSAYHFSDGFGKIRIGDTYDAINTHQIKISEMSRLASEIELNPISVCNLPSRFLEDTETVFYLCSHAIDVLDYALASPNYDDISKVQFARDRKMIETLKTKARSTMPERKVQMFGED